MTSNVAQSYVGITGVSSPWEVETISMWLDKIGWPTDRLLMNGVLVSSKSLAGAVPSNPLQYPDVCDVPKLMSDNPRLFNVAHFNISGLSQNPSLICELPRYMEDLAEKLPLDGIQLNVPWPSFADLRRFRDQSAIKLIFKVSGQMFRALGRDHDALIDRLRDYEGLVDYVLFDPSGGMGRAFDPEEASRVLAALTDSGLPFQWGVAGGLASDTVRALRPLLRRYPDLCWDAQGRLRDAFDRLDPGACLGYLRASAGLMHNIDL